MIHQAIVQVDVGDPMLAQRIADLEARVDRLERSQLARLLYQSGKMMLSLLEQHCGCGREGRRITT